MGTSQVAQWWRIHQQCRRYRFDPSETVVWKTPWSRKWKLTSVFLPGKSHGQRSLVGYSPWVTKSQTRLSTQTVCIYVETRKMGKETHLQSRNRDTDIKNKLGFIQGGKERVGWIGRLGLTCMHYWCSELKADNEWESVVQHRKLCSMLWGNSMGRKPRKEGTIYICLIHFALC